MSPIITYALLLSMCIYAIIILIELIANRSWKRFGIEIFVLGCFVAILHWTTGFPITNRYGFGGVSPVVAIGIMFACTILGIIAQYFFNARGKISWRSIVKPLCISPIVLLPLLGSIQGMTTFESIQLISFGLLAFQNGFFWKTVLEHAKPQTK